MAIDFPDSPSVGQTTVLGDKTWTWNGTVWNLVTSSGSDHGTLGGLLDDDHTHYLLADGSRSLSGSLLPDTDVTYDLGSTTYRFRDLYLSGNSIDLGGMVISYDGSNVSMVPDGGSAQVFATETYVDTSVSNLIGGAPAALDTLNELAAALNDDASYATTITNALAGKLDLSGGTLSGNLFLNTGKLQANRAGATAGTAAGGIDMLIDGTTYGQIYMNSGTEMRFNASTNWFTGNVTANRFSSDNSLVLNNYTTVQPSSNVYLYSPPNNKDAWIYLDSADTGSNWGVYHRQIDSTVGDVPANSIAFVGGGSSAANAYISLANGSSWFRSGVTSSGFSVGSGSSANAYAGGSNYWRPQDVYGNSYFDINSGSFYVDAAAYYFRNASSQNRLEINSAGAVIAYVGVDAGYFSKSITNAYASLAAWPNDGNWLGLMGGNGYILIDGSYADDDIYVRTYNNSGRVNIGAGHSNTLQVDNGSATLNGTLYGGGDFNTNYRLTGSWGGVNAPGIQMRSGNTFNTSWTGSLQLYVDYTHIKNFVIDHPSNPADQWLIHACAEGPTADVFYRGEAQLENGIVIIELPEYFEDLTELEGRSVMITPIAGPNGNVANLAAYEVSNGRFVVEQVGGYNVPNQRFWWRVDAVRKNTSFPVQPMKTDVTIGGTGPYRYIQEMA